MITTDIDGLVEKFDIAAKTWGWESDQGYGSSVELAKFEYEETKAALIQAITDLSAENAALRAQLAEAVVVIKLWERYDTSDMTDVDCMLAYADAISANRAALAKQEPSQ